MPQFDVYRSRSSAGLLLDCQSDLLTDLNTRFVAPLIPEAEAPRPADRLNPVFAIEGESWVMLTQFAAAVRKSEFGERVTNLEAQRYTITNALDLLIGGA